MTRRGAPVSRAAVLSASGLALMLAACGGTLPQTPRYATRLDQLPPTPPPAQAPLTEAEPVYEPEPIPAPTEDVTATELAPLPPAQPRDTALASQPIDAPPPPPPADGSAPANEAPANEAEDITSRLNNAPVTQPFPVREPARPAAPAQSQPLPPPGSTYTVQPGDTLSGVGRRFGVRVATLMTLNGLGPEGAVRAGQRLVLPEGVIDNGVDPYATGPAPTPLATPPQRPVTPPPPVQRPAPPPAQTPPPVQRPAPQQPPAQPQPAPPPAATDSADAPRFRWPVDRAEVVGRFGQTGVGLRNDGIVLAAQPNAAVVAAAAGQVVYAGSDIPGLGATVVIDHGDGWGTAYLQLGSVTVRERQQVAAGETLGRTAAAGSNGRSQFQFEIRRRNSPTDRFRPVDPLPLLPGR
ncbi:peptidoglycan DD-metalloendopeptidase family protein [Brevundimonas sp. 2R-24]|uniref:Peptidoglycan DD-metalloendopeptidase family protein n=1 Tax=Peiella sedimenti TaxID=3061083 RepID=A0ABT8SIP9_9CAUL|nr:peptidoglycan DD-metalloendopeptidase family protein [Caulobacteraceae bacterium XZ-24]